MLLLWSQPNNLLFSLFQMFGLSWSLRTGLSVSMCVSWCRSSRRPQWGSRCSACAPSALTGKESDTFGIPAECSLVMCVCTLVCVCSYHAVTSWSRVKGMGIPLWKAVEVTLIWLVAVLFAVPEALAFDMLEIPYRGKKLRVCLLHPEQTTSFMKVIPPPTVTRALVIRLEVKAVELNGPIPITQLLNISLKGQTGSICVAHYLIVFDMWSEMPIARISKCFKCEIQLSGSTQSRGPSRQQSVLQDRASFSNSSSKKANLKIMIKDWNHIEQHKNFDRHFFNFARFKGNSGWQPLCCYKVIRHSISRRKCHYPEMSRVQIQTHLS